MALAADIDASLIHFSPAEILLEPFVTVAGSRNQVVEGEAVLATAQAAMFGCWLLHGAFFTIGFIWNMVIMPFQRGNCPGRRGGLIQNGSPRGDSPTVTFVFYAVDASRSAPTNDVLLLNPIAE